MIVHSPTIVLRRFSYSDTSIIARCFTREMGKISFIIRGAKRKKSPQSAFYEPMSHLDIVFSHNKRRDLHLVTKASFASTYLNIHKDLKRIAYGMALVELTEKTLIDEDPNKELFDELIAILKIVDSEQVTSATKSERSGGERFSNISYNSCSFSMGPNTHNTVPCSLTLLVNALVSIPSIPGTP